MVILAGSPLQKMRIIKMRRQIMLWSTFIGIFFLVAENGKAQSSAPKTETMYIQTDKLPSSSAEKADPTHPFFAANTSPQEELLEMIEGLKKRVEQLETALAATNVIAQPNGILVIEAKGDIEINTPGTVKFKAKSVEMPKGE